MILEVKVITLKIPDFMNFIVSIAMAFQKKLNLLILILFFLSSCASVDAVKIEEQGFETGTFYMTVQTYELLLHENYELLRLMDEEGDIGPSRHRNLIRGRLNSALYHLGAIIKSFEGRQEWPGALLQYVQQEGYLENNRQFIMNMKEQWESQWKESFDDEDPEGYRMVAIETYIEFGNAFKIKGLGTRDGEKVEKE